MDHSPECIRDHELYEQEKVKFEAEHPYYCRTCGGWGGGSYTFKPAPGPGYLADYSTCPDCVDNGLCPWCQNTIMDDETLSFPEVCPFCGRKEEDYGFPEQPECFCWYSSEEYQEMQSAELRAELEYYDRLDNMPEEERRALTDAEINRFDPD